jgi:hypothetical protein
LPGGSRGLGDVYKRQLLLASACVPALPSVLEQPDPANMATADAVMNAYLLIVIILNPNDLLFLCQP